MSSRPGRTRCSRTSHSRRRDGAMASGSGSPATIQDALALEVRPAIDAPVRHAPGRHRRPSTARISSGVQTKNLPSWPSESASCGGVEAAGRVGHLAQQIVERLLAHAAAFGIAERQPGVEVERGQLGVVVQHLLEVRHQPVRVDRIAREAAAELVVHPPARHADQVSCEPCARRRGSACASRSAARTPRSSAGETSARPPARPIPRRTARTIPGTRRTGSPRPGASPSGAAVRSAPRDSLSCCPDCTTSPRRDCQASAIACSSRGKPGRP